MSTLTRYSIGLLAVVFLGSATYAADLVGPGPREKQAVDSLTSCKKNQRAIARKVLLGKGADIEIKKAQSASSLANQQLEIACNYRRMPDSDAKSRRKYADAQNACKMSEEIKTCFDGMENLKQIKGPQAKNALEAFRDCDKRLETLNAEISLSETRTAQEIAAPSFLLTISARDIARATACSHRRMPGSEAENDEAASACQWNKVTLNCYADLKTIAESAINNLDGDKAEAPIGNSDVAPAGSPSRDEAPAGKGN